MPLEPPADIRRLNSAMRTATADLIEFATNAACDNARLRRETEQFAAIKAILNGETK